MVLGLALLAGCGDSSSPSAFNRGTRYLCASATPPQSNTAERFCAADFTTPISGDFRYKNKLGETLLERYSGGYVIYAERLDASGKTIERANRTIKNGLLVRVERIFDSHRIVSDIYDWGFKSTTYREGEEPVVRVEKH